MFKRQYLGPISVVFFMSIVFATLVASLFLSVRPSSNARPSNTGNINANSTTTSVSTLSTTTVQQSANRPYWWHPCLQYDRNDSNKCTRWDTTTNPVQCDGYNYQKRTGVTSFVLNNQIWKGIAVCGPRPRDTRARNDNLVEFTDPTGTIDKTGATEQEFECTELVKRYIRLAYNKPAVSASGGQLVDQYVSTYSDTFHKVNNDGKIQMYPVEGDVLSFSYNHTAIVTNSNDNRDGTVSIRLIEQNYGYSDSGTRMLTFTMRNAWKFADTYGVYDWMTTRPVSLSQSPVPTPTPTQTPVSVPPTLTVSPTTLHISICTVHEFIICTVTLSASANSQGSLNWTASSNGGPAFNPASGTLSPGQSTQVTIQMDCAPHTLTYVGSGNTVTGTMNACPTMTLSPTSLSPNSANCTLVSSLYQCTVTLSETANSTDTIPWTALPSGSVQFNPASGTLSPGQSVQVTISSIPCQNAVFVFYGYSGVINLSTAWTCP